MSLALPSSKQPIIDEKVMQEQWRRYFQDAHNALGLAGAVFPLWSNRGMIAASSMDLDDSSAPPQVVVAGGIKARGFDTGVEQSMHAVLVLGSGYQTGVELRPCIRWMPSASGGGSVRWGIEYVWIDINSPVNLSQTVYVNTVAATALKPVVERLASVSGSKNLGPGSTVLFRIFRQGTDLSDTYAAPAILLAAGFVTSDNAPGTAEVKP